MKSPNKGIFPILLLVLVLITVTGCRQNQPAGEDIDLFQMTPSSRGVDDFLRQHNNDYPPEYDSSTCYNVTPENISEQYGINIYKFDMSCESLLLYENQVYPLGTWFGGLGVTSFAVTDLNKDGAFELYFTYSWGSGISRSHIGFFDSADNKIVTFDFTAWSKEMVLGTDENGVLCTYEADCDITSFVDIKMLPGRENGEIVCNSDNILFVETGD